MPSELNPRLSSFEIADWINAYFTLGIIFRSQQMEFSAVRPIMNMMQKLQANGLVSPTEMLVYPTDKKIVLVWGGDESSTRFYVRFVASKVGEIFSESDQ